MKRILITGGAGYIGAHTAYAMAEQGYNLCIADNLSTGHMEALHPSAVFYQGDLCDAAFLEDLFSRESIDAVIHFAAKSLVGESMQQPLLYYGNNVHGTEQLLSAMVRHGVRHIVFSSTAAVYGEPARIPIAEEDAAAPTNPYGQSKLSIEQMLYWAEAAHGLRFASLRYFNACGAHASGAIGEAHTPETHLIPIVLQTALGQRDAIQIYGADYDTPDGTCIRDYIHVDDLAQAHILALAYLQRENRSMICNLGNGVGFSVLEVIAAAERVVGAPIPAVTAPRRAGDPARLVASSGRARTLLGWSPQISDINNIVASAWRWHKTHPRGYGHA